ncbi:rhodanese-like domain-containing protein [Vibrio sp. SS-MA-C1-2]|uniref:rhodanese-like domain-containing protein n=1 Tax=Vibrio sp. SS-MA-C1-2 TaxID=2908646 RepID=UPI001F204889|nr:rhodanese-like domain-containing protein [Vibrio sp. SS-MA-C1-2]UJF19257.1 rhodanese-like domain-containing protein [Vibrio sp. SS-MA-C1-2]
MQEYITFFTANPILSLAWVGIFVAILVTYVKQKSATYTIVSPAETTRLLNREEGVIVDIRSRDEYRQGHIACAHHILPSDIKNNTFGELEKHKNTPIIVVCKTGQTSIANADELTKAGFTSVSVLKDGLISWNEASMPLVRSKKKK